MKGLFRPPGRKIWMFRLQRNKKRKAVSTGTRNYREARTRAKALQMESDQRKDVAWEKRVLFDAPEKKCTKCRTLKPETAEHFAPDKRTGKLAACCRECNNSGKRKRTLQRSGGVEYAGVGEIRERVTRAYRERDPDGAEVAQARRALEQFFLRYRLLPQSAKVDLMTSLMPKFLKSEQ